VGGSFHRSFVPDYYLDGDVLRESSVSRGPGIWLDQVSAISDPWREASDFGMEFDYPEQGVGKPLRHLIEKDSDVNN
jgi:hypothetical protein